MINPWPGNARRWALLVWMATLLPAWMATAAEDEPLQETADVQAKARRLGAKFAGGRACVPEAFGALEPLRDVYGVQGIVGQSLALAYRGCDDDVAWAELFAARIRPEESDEARLKLAAAWILAHRWPEAYAVALPLARAQGSESRAAWLTGYALFQLDEREAAAPWLLGARSTVDGKKRTDATIMLALVQAERGQGAAARAELTAAIERMPDEASLHATLSLLLSERGQPEEASKEAARARELARAAEAQTRARARFQALEESLREASGDDAVVAVVDRMALEGPVKEVIALFERQRAAVDASEHPAVARRLQAHLRALRRP